jgi:hypothetical protein
MKNEWQIWLAKHKSQLAASALPISIYENEHAWFYFLEHGEYPGVAGKVAAFQVSELSQPQAQYLLNFLREHAQIKNSDAERDIARLISTT